MCSSLAFRPPAKTQGCHFHISSCLSYGDVVTEQVVEDSAGNVKIVSSNAGKDFAAEEISAQVLRKLVDDAGKFLNDKVRHLWLLHSQFKPCIALLHC